MPPTMTSMSSALFANMSGFDERERRMIKAEDDDENESLDRRSSGSFEGSSDGSAGVTPDRFSLNQQKESEYEQPSQFILGQGQVSLQPAEKTDGQLSRNQPQDLSTASKKLDDGSL